MFVIVYHNENEENLEILTEIIILTDFDQISKFLLLNIFQSAPHDHAMPGRGISLQKPSEHDWGRPQCTGELWSRLRMSPTIVLNTGNFGIFRPVTARGKSMVERGLVRKVAPGGATTNLLTVRHAEIRSFQSASQPCSGSDIVQNRVVA